MSFDSLFCTLIITGASHWLAILVSFIFNMMEALINCWSFATHLSYVNDEFKPFFLHGFDIIQNNFGSIEFRFGLEFKPNRILIMVVPVMICVGMQKKFAELVIQNFDNIDIVVRVEHSVECEWPAPLIRIKT